MSILSLNFVIFTIATVIVYYIVPLKGRWIVLLAANAVFYGLAGWEGSIWLFLVSAITFLSSLLQHKLILREKDVASKEDIIKKNKQSEVEAAADEAAVVADIPSLPSSGWFSSSKKVKKLRKIVLAVSIIIPLLAMAFTKYYDCVRAWITTLPAFALIVPLGLSYFTFQCVGYMTDVYRAKIEPERNPLKMLLFTSFFPLMTQGPISQYSQLMPQLAKGNRFNPDNFMAGVQLALWGFFKKMVIADRLTAVTEAVSTKERGWMVLLTAIIYLIRLYCDFSGGVDVIRGAAKMLGIDVIENFRRPFFSLSVAEYWRRWHISLGNWFRNYLYYPISTSGFGIWLSKVGKKIFGKKAGRALPAAVSNVIIFFLIGIWHTANGNALVYGLYFGLLLGIELLLDPTFKKIKKKLHINEKNVFWKAFTMVRTFILVLIPQYFAFTANPSEGLSIFGATFTNWKFTNVPGQFTDIMTPLQWYIAAIAVAILLIVDILCEKIPELNMKIARGPFYIRWILLILLILAVLIYGCYGEGYDATAFLYTHF